MLNLFGSCCVNSGAADFELEFDAESKSIPVPEKIKDKEWNIMLLTDSYKETHWKQYPPGTTVVYSYFESRGGEFPDVCFFGLQYFIKRYLCGPVVTKEKIDEAEAICQMHFGHPVYGEQAKFNREGWEYILNQHGGYLPISIKAVPEGTVVPTRNVLFTMVNTDPNCFWLTNFLETLLVQVWYPATVATQSREQKITLSNFFKDTGCDMAGLGFMLHDFGFRGVSSVESAGIGGAGHLVNFMGTDTMAALEVCKNFYHDLPLGFSIPASEHSTITSWTREGEKDAMRNMLEAYPKGLVACVSDSFDIYNACSNIWGGELKSMIEKREGRLIVRPDSGELPKIVLDVLDRLGEKFGTEKTSTGHKKLPDYIRMIQGDGIDKNSLKMILTAMKDAGWAAENSAFGSGGALLQKLNRDTNKFAFKCSYAKIKGQSVDVLKDPITDPGKKSKPGLLTLEKDADGKFMTTVNGKGDKSKDLLVEVFRNGYLLVDYKMEDIRTRANVGVPNL
jgi:nicotinamide phosphoribosyltransferase